jgi:hypothetical protein
MLKYDTYGVNRTSKELFCGIKGFDEVCYPLAAALRFLRQPSSPRTPSR